MEGLLKWVIGFALVLVIIGTVVSGQVANIKNNADKGQKDQQKVDVLLTEADAVTGITVKNYISQAIAVNSGLTVTYTNTGGTAVPITSGGTMPTNIKDKSLYNITKSYNANGELSAVTCTQKDMSN